jgi:phosphoribosyl 1,2-cyclic phosphodiesterase
MSLFIASLNSGSNGNCYYVGNQHEAVLIDGGISCRETELRMKRLGLNLKKVKAIFVTHEHFDHTKGIPTLSKKYQLPVYITDRTQQHARLRLINSLVIPLTPHTPIAIGQLTVTAFPKRHDACDPHSIIVSNETVKVGVFTDIGSSCEHVIKHFAQCHAAFLEANYDEEMLENGVYPLHLKNRIRDGEGHLSNTQAADLFMKYKPEFMSHLFLSHLSKNNNSPTLVENLFKKIAGSTEIIIATRYRETELYPIHANGMKGQRKNSFKGHEQLSLFR